MSLKLSNVREHRWCLFLNMVIFPHIQKWEKTAEANSTGHGTQAASQCWVSSWSQCSAYKRKDRFRELYNKFLQWRRQWGPEAGQPPCIKVFPISLLSLSACVCVFACVFIGPLAKMLGSVCHGVKIGERGTFLWGWIGFGTTGSDFQFFRGSRLPDENSGSKPLLSLGDTDVCTESIIFMAGLHQCQWGFTVFCKIRLHLPIKGAV